MAVTIKSKALTITSLVKRLFPADDVSAELEEKAERLTKGKYELVTMPTTFKIRTATDHSVAAIDLKLDTVRLAMKGQIGHTVKVLIRDKVINLLNTAYQHWLDQEALLVDKVLSSNTKNQSAKLPSVKDEVMEAVFANGTLNKVKGIKLLRELTGTSLKEAKDLCELWIEQWTDGDFVAATNHVEKFTFDNELQTPVYDVPPTVNVAPQVETYADPLHSPVVLLKNATRLHERVRGTDGSSVYHVIALGESCIVAARVKSNNNIAIRAEVIQHHASKGAQSAKKGLIAAGLDQKNGGHYSLHIDPPDFNMVKRSIGSILFATEIDFTGVSVNLKEIQGAGA